MNVCPSGRLSIKRSYCVETCERIITQLTLYELCSFLTPKSILMKSNGVTPTVRQIHVGKICDFRPTADHISQTAQDRDSVAMEDDALTVGDWMSTILPHMVWP